jgi:DNA-binding NarL/FixJ family response regulator
VKTIRVILVEDHRLVRAGIRILLESVPGIEVVGEALDGREAIELVEKRQPDIVLMDITMPGMNGLDATARIAKEAPRTRVIILSMHSTEEYVVQALRAGAAGYLLKDAGTAELELAVQAVVAGGTYLSPVVSKHVVGGYMRRLDGELVSRPELTPRQREILQLVAEGRTTKEIAQVLGLGVKTVETHRTELMARLKIREVAGLVRYAIRVGLVSAEQ